MPIAARAAAPSATRKDLQLGRRLVHCANGCAIATAYALIFTHQQIVHTSASIACLVYILDRVRIHYPELLERAPWVNRLLFRAEEQFKESAMTPYAIAILLTLLTFPKTLALIAIYTLAIADPLSALVGITWGRRHIVQGKSVEGSLAFFVATAAHHRRRAADRRPSSPPGRSPARDHDRPRRRDLRDAAAPPRRQSHDPALRRLRGLAACARWSASSRLSSMHVVYILRCGDGTLYTGAAKDLARRLEQHAAGTGVALHAGATAGDAALVAPRAHLGRRAPDRALDQDPARREREGRARSAGRVSGGRRGRDVRA